MQINVILAGLPEDGERSVLERMEALVEELRKSADRPVSVNCLYVRPESENGDIEKDGTELVKAWAGHQQAPLLWVLPEESRGLSQDVCCAAAAFLAANPARIHLFCGTAEGEELGRRTAALLGTECLGKTEGFLQEDGLRLRHKVYSTHGEGRYPLHDACSSGTAAAEGNAGHVIIGSPGGRRQAWEEETPAAAEAGTDGMKVKMFRLQTGALPAAVTVMEEPRHRKDDLASARLVFVGGKGLGTKENYLRLKALAGKLGAACGCSRPAALSGWESYDRVVGISGVSLQADLCVTFGVSGAGPLVSGLEGAAHVIAVNSDKKAPIFRYAQEGIAEDCMKIITALEEKESIWHT